MSVKTTKFKGRNCLSLRYFKLIHIIEKKSLFYFQIFCEMNIIYFRNITCIEAAKRRMDEFVIELTFLCMKVISRSAHL